MDAIHPGGTLSDIVIRDFTGRRVHERRGSPIHERFSSVPLLQEISNVNPSMYHDVTHTITNPLPHHSPAVNQSGLVKSVYWLKQNARQWLSGSSFLGGPPSSTTGIGVARAKAARQSTRMVLRNIVVFAIR